LTKTKRISLISKALVVALKKIKTFYHFSRLNLHFQSFSRSGKLLGKFQTFSRIQDPTNPDYRFGIFKTDS